MKGKCLTAVLLSAILCFAVASLRAADDMSAPATQPSSDMPMMRHSHRLFEPYGLLTDLSDDQKTQIEKIHADFLAQEKTLREKQDGDIMALLTPEQKAELSKDMESSITERKEKAAARRKQKMMDEPTTMPAR